MIGDDPGGATGFQAESHDLYEGFAERYDLFGGGRGETGTAETAFFQKLFADHQLHTVLDCACGTGSHLRMLHSLGYEATGSDISESMLARARKMLAEQDINVPLFRVDYRDLPQHFSEQFDAVICLSSSISHMPDDTQVLKAFRSMRHVLRDGGLLILSQGTTDKQWKEKPRFILAVNTPEVSRLFVIDYIDPLNRRARYNVLDILHQEAHDALKVWGTDYYILLQEDLERLLQQAGFRAVEFFGSYGFNLYDREASNRLIAVAQK